jgi:type III restriction enzyme
VIEWRKAYEEHNKLGKKAILFVMTDDTRNCDEVAAYLEAMYADLQGAVLVIHTKQNGEISEAATGRAKEELEQLRALANDIDSPESPYKAIVSVLMLKEGWDVRNVTTIVGLRAFTSRSSILPEQTLGRGLRKMYAGGLEEGLSVIGTDAFMTFVESIQAEGVTLERAPMGPDGTPNPLLAIEVDRDNEQKDLESLNLEIPILSARVIRQPNALADLDPLKVPFNVVTYQDFPEEELREIIFRDIASGDITHTTVLDAASVGDYRNVIGYFAQTLCKQTSLFSSHATLYGHIKRFVQSHLFGREIDLENPNTLRNLAELAATKTILDTFTKAINDVTISDRGSAEVVGSISLMETRPFMAKQQPFLVAKRSVFNRIIGDLGFELKFAEFLEQCPDVISFAKNYQSIGFKLDYAKDNGDLSSYTPDFIVKSADDTIVIVETKGQVDVDVPHKMRRLAQWVEDVNSLQENQRFEFVFVDEDGFETYRPKSLASLLGGFREYKL